MTSQGQANTKKFHVRWTERMDDVLVDILLEEGRKGSKKSDNGWKREALQHVMDEVRKITGVTVNFDNIKARLKTMKKEYLMVKEAINQIGFDFNSVTKYITADDDAWQRYIEGHPNAVMLRSKPFRHFEAWTSILENDQATGDMAAAEHDIPTSPEVAQRMAIQAQANTKKSHVRWTEKMDDVLVNILFEEATKGSKKPGNGWKPEALQHVTNEVKKVTGMAVNFDNIKARLKTMKKEYLTAREAISQSGFSFNSVTQSVVADDDTWERYIEGHPNAVMLRNKPFRHYEAWAIIIGNEQGTEDRAAERHDIPTSSEVPQSVQNDQNVFDLDEGDEGESHLPGAAIQAAAPIGSDTSMKRSRTTPSGRCKRACPMEDGIQSGIQMLAEAAREIAASLKGINWNMLTAALRSMPKLTRGDVFVALEMFGKEPNLVPLFLSLNEEERQEWTTMKLAGKGL